MIRLLVLIVLGWLVGWVLAHLIHKLRDWHLGDKP
jgi:NhaP-type Na+/H+ or K+/H+ antiporter